MTVTFAGDAITVTSTTPPDDLDDMVTAVGNTALMDLIIPEARVFFMDDVKWIINQSAQFIDTEFHLHHTKDNAWTTGVDRAIEYVTGGSIGLTEWGKVDNTDIFAPIVTEDAWYHYNITFTPGNVFWSNQTFGAGTDGDFRQYGGVFDGSPRGSTSGGQFWYMPQTRCDMIGLMSERWGGQRLWGTNYICREVIQKGGQNASPGANSGPYGFSLGGISTVDDALFEIVIENSNYGYYFFAANGGVLKGASLRELNEELVFNAATAALDVDLNDCDPYTSIGVTGADPLTGATIRENTTSNFLFTEEDGTTAIQNVRLRIWRTVPSTVEVTAGTSGVGELTNSSGVPASGEMLLQTTQWDGNGSAPTFAQQTDYGPYNMRIRDYGRNYITETKIPAPPIPIVEQFLMVEHGLTLGGTVETTVSGLTGIVQNEGSSTIEVTSAHTIEEIFSWLQFRNADTGQMDTTLELSPLTTFNNLLYTIVTGWTMSNISGNVDIDLSILELANGDRWVPINLSSAEEDTSFWINDTDAPSVLYSGNILPDGNDEFKTKRLYTGTDINTLVRARLKGYKTFVQVNIINNTGMLIAINSIKDPNFQFPRGRMDQTHFRWRNDNGTETTATFKQLEDVDHTGQNTLENVRLRILIDEFFNKPNNHKVKLQYRQVGDSQWSDIE